ncbi:MAG: hypothetical protein IJ202_13655 [Bacteroidales bacterium]|nr:hypothetical protein [Bacteroidales bacterium]
MRNNKENILSVIICLALGFLFCLKFSLSTSPAYGPSLLSHDAAIFYIIGKFWSQGVVPYLELWDHKGPMIFFVNLLGYRLTGSTLGVFIIQCFSLSVSIFFVYRIFRLRFASVSSWLFSIVSILWLACSYEGGDLTEEYLLPYLTAAFYLIAKWIDKYEQSPCDHNPWNAFLLGFVLAFSFLTRLTNALGACGAMLAIGLVLLKDQRWNNLFQNILAFIGGFLVLAVPFVVYFYSQGALNEFLFGSFIYNVSNMNATSGGFSNQYWLRNIVPFSIMAISCLGLFFVSIYMFFSNPKHRVGAFVWLLATFFLGTWLFRSSLMSHYRTVALPFFPILVLELYKLDRWFHPVLRALVLSLLVFGPIFITVRKWSSFVDYFDRPFAVELAQQVKEDVPVESLPDLIVYGDPQMYLLLDIKPIYRNFSFPGTQGTKHEKLKEDIRREYSSCKADYVLVSGDSSMIQDILDSKYDLVKEYNYRGSYKLWKNKDM